MAGLTGLRVRAHSNNLSKAKVIFTDLLGGKPTAKSTDTDIYYTWDESPMFVHVNVNSPDPAAPKQKEGPDVIEVLGIRTQGANKLLQGASIGQTRSLGGAQFLVTDLIDAPLRDHGSI